MENFLNLMYQTVTGAGAGIGKGVAIGLAAGHARVVVSDVGNLQAANETVECIRNTWH